MNDQPVEQSEFDFLEQCQQFTTHTIENILSIYDAIQRETEAFYAALDAAKVVEAAFHMGSLRTHYDYLRNIVTSLQATVAEPESLLTESTLQLLVECAETALPLILHVQHELDVILDEHDVMSAQLDLFKKMLSAANQSGI